MSRADDLKRMIDPARRPGESRAAYIRRRMLATVSVAQAVKGRLAVAGIKYGMVPAAGVDPALDEQILRGDLRVIENREQAYAVIRIDKPGMPLEIASRMLRLVRTKGTPYRKPKEANENPAA